MCEKINEFSTKIQNLSNEYGNSQYLFSIICNNTKYYDCNDFKRNVTPFVSKYSEIMYRRIYCTHIARYI